jgi:4-amino-4-deoxy-L-arabinose transferase-like glycosyltransferase
MIALADTMRTTSLRLVGAWNAFATRYNPFALIAVACAVLTGPLIFFRGYNSDEGLAVSIARTALEDGEWLVPHVFNIHFAAPSQPLATTRNPAARR